MGRARWQSHQPCKATLPESMCSRVDPGPRTATTTSGMRPPSAYATCASRGACGPKAAGVLRKSKWLLPVQDSGWSRFGRERLFGGHSVVCRCGSLDRYWTVAYSFQIQVITPHISLDMFCVIFILISYELSWRRARAAFRKALADSSALRECSCAR